MSSDVHTSLKCSKDYIYPSRYDT